MLGGGGVAAAVSCVWFTGLFLFCPALCSELVLDWKTWLPGVPPPPPPPPPSSPLKSLCWVHSCTVHITSTAPYSPTAAPPPRPVIAEHAPLREATAFSTSCARAQTHKHGTRTPTGGHMRFSSSPFPFSHIIQFLPLLLTLRKIPWPHDLMEA